MMRDNIKDFNYFQEVISTRESSDRRRTEKIEKGLISPERLQAVKVDMAKNQLYLTISKYSAGFSIEEMLQSYFKAVEYTSESWVGYWKLKDANGIEYNQYTLSAYDDMLWMLSLGYLLKIPNDEFQKLVDVIDQDKIKDNLFEFIITAVLPGREPIIQESYHFFDIPKIFEKLRKAISIDDKVVAKELIEEFVLSEWYKNNKDAGWHNSHKGRFNAYFGYWSFETAAVVQILGINDNSMRRSSYYPGDLINVRF